MDNPALIIDIILAAVLVISAVRAYIDGFFTAFIRMFGRLGSLIVAWYVSSQYSRRLFDNYLRQAMVEKAFEYLTEVGRSIDVKTALEALTGGLSTEFFKPIIEKARENLSRILSPTMDSAEYLVDSFIAPISISCIKVTLFVVCFLIVLILCVFLAKLLKAVNEVPLLGSANKTAGIAVGLVSGCVNIILLSFLISIIVIATGNKLSFLNGQIIAQSKILAVTGLINPFLP